LVHDFQNPIPRHGQICGRGSFFGRTGDTLFGRVGIVSLGLVGGFVVLALALVAHLATQGWPTALGGGSGGIQVLDLGLGGPGAGKSNPPAERPAVPPGLAATAGSTVTGGPAVVGPVGGGRDKQADPSPGGSAPNLVPAGVNPTPSGAGNVETSPQPVPGPPATPSPQPEEPPVAQPSGNSPSALGPPDNPEPAKPAKPQKPAKPKPPKPAKPPKGNSSTAAATSGSSPAEDLGEGGKGKGKKSGK
jgi:hypothetical protein